MPKGYTVDEEQKKQFASAYLLEKMINTPMSIPVFLEGNDLSEKFLLCFDFTRHHANFSPIYM